MYPINAMTSERTPIMHTGQPRSILMVLPVAPWPARHNGISIRYYPLIESLANRHHIDLFVHSESRDIVPDDPVVDRLRKVSILHKNLQPPGIVDRILTLAEAVLPLGEPYKFARYHSDRVLCQLRELIAGQRYDSVLWVMHEYRHLLGRLKSDFDGARTVYDSIDSPYLHHAREPPTPGMMNLWRAYDLWKTRRWERGLLSGVDGAAYISEPDAGATTHGTRIPPEVIPNGIYVAGKSSPMSTLDTGPSLGFLGNMGYAPNVQGALQLHQKVFAPLKKEFPDLRLVIIGRSPVPEVQALAGADVEVTGTVESIWPHIASVRIFVYPMTAGAGLQNKILEAMHAGKPVVTTEICVKSLGAHEWSEILVGRNDDELRAHTRTLLRNPEFARELGLRGKAYVDRTFEMSSVVERFERFLLPGDDR